MPRAPGSPSVIIANKILITQECSVSPCKINPQPGPLSRLDQAEPRADPATPGPPSLAIMWPGRCPLSLSAEGGSSGITRGSMRTLNRNQSRTYLICKSFHLLGRRHGHCERTQVTWAQRTWRNYHNITIWHLIFMSVVYRVWCDKADSQYLTWVLTPDAGLIFNYNSWREIIRRILLDVAVTLNLF